MIPLIALLLSLVLIGYLLQRDIAAKPQPSRAVWIPVFWLLINGSRQVSQWLGTGTQIAGQRLHDGDSVDQITYSLLIATGLLVLANRWQRIVQLLRSNPWLILFFLYEGMSCAWSDLPLISLRRWIKASGDIVIVLVLCSDQNPMRAITSALKRSGYVLIPLSLLFCKYYDNLGRVIDPWGQSYYTGVTLDKNMFGYLLFAYGLFFTAIALGAIRQNWSQNRSSRTEFIIHSFLLGMVALLTPLANSKTSLFALVTGVGLMIALQSIPIRRNLWKFLITAVIAGLIGNGLFSLDNTVLEASGRDSTFTGRTGIWQTVLSEPINPILGTGYASFWLGDRLQRIWDLYPNTPLLQAHNGYIEAYLNLGIIGVLLIAFLLVSGLRNTSRRLIEDTGANANSSHELFSTFSAAYVIAYIIYNFTEATFVGLNFLFIIFLLAGSSFHPSPPDHAEGSPTSRSGSETNASSSSA